MNLWILCGALLGGTAVALGAFGAHLLEGSVIPDRLETFQTAIRYQMYHSLALLLVGIITRFWDTSLVDYAGAAMLIGIILFSGSLYLLVLTDTPWLGSITPFGGLAFIVGWGLLVFSSIST